MAGVAGAPDEGAVAVAAAAGAEENAKGKAEEKAKAANTTRAPLGGMDEKSA